MKARGAHETLVVGTRGSRLALVQTRLLIARLQVLWPDVVLEERTVRTAGDAHADVALSDLVAAAEVSGGKGVFTKAIEDRLLAGDVDIAVHSAKDLPTDLPEGLRIVAFVGREDARDVLVLGEELLAGDPLRFDEQGVDRLGRSHVTPPRV